MVNPTEKSYSAAIARFFRRKKPKVIGTGFLVADGYLLTCAHVVEDALSIKRVSRNDKGDYSKADLERVKGEAMGEIIKIDFPSVSKQRLSAKVILHRFDDQDIAALQLTDVEQLGVNPIKMISGDSWNEFRVYGFPEKPTGAWVHGTLAGPHFNQWVQMNVPVDEGYPVLPGCSGSPVWDVKLGGVTGMVVARDSSEEGEGIAFMIPYRALFPVLRAIGSQGLLTILEQHEEAIADSINVVYSLFPQLEAASILSAKLQNLKNAIVGDNDPAAIHQFVAFLISPDLPNSEIGDELCNRLRAWLESEVEDVQKVMNYVKPKLAEQQQVQAEKTESHLLIYAQPNSGGKIYDVSAIFVPHYDSRAGTVLKRELVEAAEQEPFEGKVSQETLPDLVRKCLAEVNQRSPKNLTVNLILPAALINEAIDSLPLESVPALPGISLPSIRMGDRYRIVIRSSERLHPEYYRLFGEPWEKKWKTLSNLKKSEVCSAFLSGDSLTTPEDLWSKLNKDHIVGFKRSKAFSELPCDAIVGAMVSSGTPAAVWLRENNIAQTIDCAKEIDGLLKCQIHDLPEEVKKKRSDSVAEDKSVHIGHHLSLVWEDPILVPATTQSSLEMPQP